MTWSKLDDSFWSDPTIVSVGNEAAGVFCRMLSYCGQHLTDGLVPAATVNFITRKPKVLRSLVDAGLLRRMGENYGIVGFLDFNPSKEEVLSKRKVRSEAGRRGGLASAGSRSKR